MQIWNVLILLLDHNTSWHKHVMEKHVFSDQTGFLSGQNLSLTGQMTCLLTKNICRPATAVHDCILYQLTVKLLHFISDTTSSLSSCMNSSLSTSSTKCFRIYFSAAFLSSSHPWVSANVLIPKQFDGSNCSSRN